MISSVVRNRAPGKNYRNDNMTGSWHSGAERRTGIEKLLSFLDENDGRWIRIYKILILVSTCCIVLYFIAIAFDMFTGNALLTTITQEEMEHKELLGLGRLLIGAIVSSVYFALNMVFLNFVKNIQMIREKLYER